MMRRNGYPLISLPKWAPILLERADLEGIWQGKVVMG
jgi:hypothetical protein